jgi:hypothetical protein
MLDGQRQLDVSFWFKVQNSKRKLSSCLIKIKIAEISQKLLKSQERRKKDSSKTKLTLNSFILSKHNIKETYKIINSFSTRSKFGHSFGSF